MEFRLNSRLEADCHVIKDLQVSRVLLMDNANFPWLILVPRIDNASELFDLPPDILSLFMDEVTRTAQAVKKNFKADKMNIAMLGNQVAQLHCHVIARFKNDSAWPNPVWGIKGERYSNDTLQEKITELQVIITASNSKLT